MTVEQWDDIEASVLEAAGLADEELEQWLSRAPEPIRRQARLLLDAPLIFGPWAAEAAARVVSSAPRLKVPCNLSHYRVLRRVGSGGMGEVYEAEDPRLQRKVAIKVLHPGAARRLDEEAQALARLRHPNICRIYDVGRADDIEYFVMELLDGVPLSTRLEKGPLAPAEALPLASAVARALAEAHRLGVVHRDVKPANILLTRNGPSLVDFGIADRVAGGVAIPAGTPPYMASEQSRGVCDPRSDIYSLGAVMREMLAPDDAAGQSARSSIRACRRTRKSAGRTRQTSRAPWSGCRSRWRRRRRRGVGGGGGRVLSRPPRPEWQCWRGPELATIRKRAYSCRFRACAITRSETSGTSRWRRMRPASHSWRPEMLGNLSSGSASSTP